MSIRPASQADIVQTANLVRSLTCYYLDNPDSELPPWFEETLTEEAFSARIKSPDYLNLVYEENGTVVGYFAVKLPGHIYHLFISEQYQGKGLSRLLWEHFLRQSDCRTFSLRSSVFAIPVYRRFGFTETGPINIKDGVSFQPMELRLVC